MRYSARRRWATSASTSRTPTRGSSGADSRALLRHVVAIVAEKGWKVGNVDATIVAQAPKMAPHIETMRGLIAEDLGVAVDQVNVKATTTERLGFTGREEGIAVHAVALLMAR